MEIQRSLPNEDRVRADPRQTGPGAVADCVLIADG